MRVSIRAELKETHDFEAWCLDSSMGQVLMLAAAADFLERLIKVQPDRATWGPLALEEGLKAGLMKIEVDTLRNSPVNASDVRGAVQHEGLVLELAERMQAARVEDGRARGLHPPCHPENMCRGCRPDLVPFHLLPGARRQDLLVMAKAALAVLAEKGLTA